MLSQPPCSSGLFDASTVLTAYMGLSWVHPIALGAAEHMKCCSVRHTWSCLCRSPCSELIWDEDIHFLQGVPQATLGCPRISAAALLEPALPSASPDSLFLSWAAAAHLPLLLGLRWRWYVQHALDPRFVSVRTTPTPPPLPRRRRPGALNSLPRPVSDFRVTAFFWNSYKKIEEFCRPGIRVATFTLEIPLLHWRGFRNMNLGT